MAFVGLRKGIEYHINSENPFVTEKAIEPTRITSLQTQCQITQIWIKIELYNMNLNAYIYCNYTQKIIKI